MRPPGLCGAIASGRWSNFSSGGKSVSTTRAPPPTRAEQGRQAVIGLRPEDQVHIRRAGEDLLALRLGHAAGDGEHHASPCIGCRALQQAQAPQFGKHLFRRAVTDMAGVEDDQIGIGRRRRGDIAGIGQHVAHAGAVIDVHLTAPGDHMQPPPGDRRFDGLVQKGRSEGYCARNPRGAAGAMVIVGGQVKRKGGVMPPSGLADIAMCSVAVCGAVLSTSHRGIRVCRVKNGRQPQNFTACLQPDARGCRMSAPVESRAAARQKLGQRHGAMAGRLPSPRGPSRHRSGRFRRARTSGRSRSPASRAAARPRCHRPGP